MDALTATADIQIRGSPPAVFGVGAARAPRPAPETLTQTREPGDTQPEAQSEDLKQALEGVNAFLKASGTRVQFAMHQETKRMMVEVLDDVTGEILRTIPSKELLDLSARIGELVGVLLDKKG